MCICVWVYLSHLFAVWACLPPHRNPASCSGPLCPQHRPNWLLCHSTSSSPASQADSLAESGAPQGVSFSKTSFSQRQQQCRAAAACSLLWFSVSGLRISWAILLSAHIDFPVDYITSNHKRNCAPLLECQGEMNSKHFPAGGLALPSKAGHCPRPLLPAPCPNLPSPTSWKFLPAEVGHQNQPRGLRMPNYASVRSLCVFRPSKLWT